MSGHGLIWAEVRLGFIWGRRVWRHLVSCAGDLEAEVFSVKGGAASQATQLGGTLVVLDEVICAGRVTL